MYLEKSKQGVGFAYGGGGTSQIASISVSGLFQIVTDSGDSGTSVVWSGAYNWGGFKIVGSSTSFKNELDGISVELGLSFSALPVETSAMIMKESKTK